MLLFFFCRNFAASSFFSFNKVLSCKCYFSFVVAIRCAIFAFIRITKIECGLFGHRFESQNQQKLVGLEIKSVKWLFLILIKKKFLFFQFGIKLIFWKVMSYFHYITNHRWNCNFHKLRRSLHLFDSMSYAHAAKMC